MSTEWVANTRLNLKILSVTFLIVTSFVLIDVVISGLVDVYYDFTTSPAGMALFLIVSCVLFGGTYVILGQKEMKMEMKGKITIAVWIVYYSMIATMAFVILQLLLFSEYYTGLLAIAPIISYGLAAFLMGLLAYHFFSWFVRNKAPVVLLYGLASASSAILVVLATVIFCGDVLEKPAIMTFETSSSFLSIESESEEFLIVTLPSILAAIVFLSFWGGTILVLHSNIRRIGKTRFWILVTTPIVFFLGSLITAFPGIQEAAPEDDPNSIIIPVYLVIFSQVIAIALFAIAFVSMAKAIPHDNHQISYYMYITCFGLTLSSIGFISTIAGTGYPPFGLPSVSLGGSFAFLLFVGLYRSAISTAEDYSLRRSIKNSARQELKLLDSIGTSEMERKLEKKILDVTKLNADNLKQQSGIEPSLSMDEAKQYLYEVLEEVKEIKK